MFACVNGFVYSSILFCFQQLIRNLDRDLQYAITVEGKMDIDSILNYEDVKNAIMEKVNPHICLSSQAFASVNSV